MIEEGRHLDTNSGTPQGGIISPLLANIALHGIEEALGVKYNSYGELIGKRSVVRYADDFVVFCESREDTILCQEILREWLSSRGLQLSGEKTRIAHLSEGFDFLGFNVRQYPKVNTKTGWKLLIKPSNEAVQNLRDKLKTEWLSLRGHNVTSIINQLNPIIRGWANYHRIGVTSEIFRELDH